jgi:hypothetical protein
VLERRALFGRSEFYQTPADLQGRARNTIGENRRRFDCTSHDLVAGLPILQAYGLTENICAGSRAMESQRKMEAANVS